MDSGKNLGYTRLREDELSYIAEVERRAFLWIRRLLRRRWIQRIRPRIRVRRLRRFWFWKKRSGFLSRLRVSWGKALRRLKNGQGHLNDLLAGNFLVMQGGPDPLGAERRPATGHGHRSHHHGLAPKVCERYPCMIFSEGF